MDRKPVEKNDRKLPESERGKATQVQEAEKVPIKMNSKRPYTI